MFFRQWVTHLRVLFIDRAPNINRISFSYQLFIPPLPSPSHRRIRTKLLEAWVIPTRRTSDLNLNCAWGDLNWKLNILYEWTMLLHLHYVLFCSIDWLPMWDYLRRSIEGKRMRTLSFAPHIPRTELQTRNSRDWWMVLPPTRWLSDELDIRILANNLISDLSRDRFYVTFDLRKINLRH